MKQSYTFRMEEDIRAKLMNEKRKSDVINDALRLYYERSETPPVNQQSSDDVIGMNDFIKRFKKACNMTNKEVGLEMMMQEFRTLNLLVEGKDADGFDL